MGLTTFPFEQDELYTVIESTRLFDSPLDPGIDARPIYFLLQHAVLSVFAPGPLTLRALPFLFGVLGIWAVWLLGRQLFGRVGGTVAAVLTVVSPWHLHMSGMARYGSLLFLLSTLFLLYVHRAYRSERRSDYLRAFAALLVGTLTHPSFVFPVVGVVMGLSLVRRDATPGVRLPTRRALTHLWLPYAASVGAGMLVLLSLGRETAVRNSNVRGGDAVWRLLPAVVEWMTPIVFTAGAIGALIILFAARRADQRGWGASAALGCAGTLAIMLLASRVTSVYADYATAMLPLVLVSVGGLVQLGAERMRSGGWALAAAALCLLVVGAAPSTVSHFLDGMRFDYRPALRHIAATAPDVVVLSTPIILQRHYAPRLHGVEANFSRDFLDAALREHGDLWIIAPVQRFGLVFDQNGEGERWLRRRCRLESSSQPPRLDYRMYRVDLYRCAPGAP